MTRTAGLLPLIAAVFIGVAASACGGGPGQGEDGAVASEREVTLEPGSIVAYSGVDELGGTEIVFHSLLGTGRPVILNFWAAQCPPCRAEMPWFQAAYDRHRGEVLLVGVDIGPFVGLGSNEQARVLLDELSITYPTARAVDDELMRRYGLLAMPTTIFFAGDGSIVRNHAGLLTQRQIDDAFAELAALAR